jgi:hypothetical protein
MSETWIYANGRLYCSNKYIPPGYHINSTNTIDANTILQADAPVIAGVLIFLTIYSLKPPGL